jgi:phytoene dehydrogenase-like protein
MYKLIKKCFNQGVNKNIGPYVYKSKDSVSNVLKNKYDVIVVGAGHNGLICANYLAKAGKKVLMLEKRHTVGGCAVTEELVEGYKMSRCSYVLALFRNIIIKELFPDFFEKVKLYKRNPKGLTVTTEQGKYLIRRSERELLKQEIAKFSKNDVLGIDRLDSFLERMVKVVDPLIDLEPPNKVLDFQFLTHILKHRNDLKDFYHFITSSADYYLDKYLESDILKGTYATDAIIGAMNSPYTPGSAYVLLHHVMGNLDNEGSWYYVEGGNGALSEYLANKAVERGVTICLNSPVEELLIDKKSVNGVEILDGHRVMAKSVVTNCDLNNTYYKLLTKEQRNTLLDEETLKGLENMNYTSPVVKINLIVDKLPNFKCFANTNVQPKDALTGTIHMNSESMKILDNAYKDALNGKISTKPVIEMTIPSILDNTLAPKGSGHHVIGLFTQYVPKDYTWNEETKKQYANIVYKEIENYSPGFTKSILYQDILTPYDLEKEFSITGGNIFHGSMNLNSIFFCRPFLGYSSYKHKIDGLYSCSSGMHPGGGVMGAPGRNCAKVMLRHI